VQSVACFRVFLADFFKNLLKTHNFLAIYGNLWQCMAMLRFYLNNKVFLVPLCLSGKKTKLQKKILGEPSCLRALVAKKQNYKKYL
jgi:hypothetical protein